MTDRQVPQPFAVKVSSVEQLGDVLSFSVSMPDSSPMPEWEAGAHVDLFLGDNLVRQYSLCGNPADRSCYKMAVLLEPASRGGSKAVHETVRLGETLTIGPPRNLFPLMKDGTYAVLVGGGIGITPLIAMAYELHDRGTFFTLHYAARSTVFASLLSTLPFAASVVVHDCSKPETALFPAGIALGSVSDKSETHVYTCGPAGLMDAVFTAGETLGYAKSHLHREAFSAEPVVGGDGFEVLAAKSGVRVEVKPNETIVAAFRRAGVKVNVSCEQGICGSCVVSVIEGKPDHRDEYLTDDERSDQIALCCSRSFSPLLVVDL